MKGFEIDITVKRNGNVLNAESGMVGRIERIRYTLDAETEERAKEIVKTMIEKHSDNRLEFVSFDNITEEEAVMPFEFIIDHKAI